MITQLRLRNFKCFQLQDLNLRPLTLLAGLNGMGKSSVLQACLVLRQSAAQGRLQQGELALNGDFVRLGTAEDVLFEAAASDDSIGLGLTLNESVKVDWQFHYDPQADILNGITPAVSDAIWGSHLFSDEFHYLQAERIGSRVVYGMSDNLVRHHRQLGTQGEYAIHFLSVFEREPLQIETLARKDAVSDKLRDQVEAWLADISPGTRLHMTPYARMDLMSLRYSFTVGHDHSNEYRPTNVGFGITYTLPVLIAILAARPGSLLLVENPEAHLHPKGQAQMGRLLALAAQGGVQILLETHSDHVLNGIRLAVHDNAAQPETIQLFYFGRNQQGLAALVTSPKIDRDGRIDRWPEGFFDEWDRSLEGLLAPRGE